LEQHCRRCHSGEMPGGDFREADLTQDFADPSNREGWQSVLQQLREGTMPPLDEPRPPAADVQRMSAWITQQIATAESVKNASRGRVPMRRLTRTEYMNTVRDLLGVEVDLTDLLPPDSPSGGFDKNAEAQHLSAYLLDGYLEAADRALDAAIASGSRPNTIDRRFDIKNERTVKPTGSVYRHEEDGVAVFSSWVSANIQITLWSFQTRGRGKYRFRISAYGIQTDKPVTFHVMAGPMSAAAQQYLIGYFSVPPGEPRVIEFTEQMESGLTIRIIADGLGATPPQIEKVGAENYDGPGLLVQWVDIEGPIIDSWPPESHRRIFGDLEQVTVRGADDARRREVRSSEPLVDAERILLAFARRAFRRAVTPAEIQPYLARVERQLEQGHSFEQAMRVALKGVLLAPDFLFLRERPGKLDDFALASRLSYFLWSSMPDEELLTLAEGNELHRPERLTEQVERMLADPKAVAFKRDFPSQWLGLDTIDATAPDGMLYPEYDDVLKDSMLKEVLFFFDEVLTNDLSLTHFVASDFSILNGRLARHYGIPGVEEGLDFHKVPLPADSHRGGVLTMGAVLKVTANGTTTSPIIRGAWVLDRILGTPPPKPTVDIEAVEPDIRGATTIRKQLSKHRDHAQCAGCHAIIDPPGFALESFDVIGGWRERYRSVGEGDPAVVGGRRMRYRNGPPVEPADKLPDGRAFENIDDYKRLLVSDPDQLARALASKLVAYATGAPPTLADQPAIDRMVDRLRDENYGFRTLIHQVVQSELFQMK
ncbi:MAG: DUF1592 domain-containing protein, partial [Planctomycetaceae bacterium]